MTRPKYEQEIAEIVERAPGTLATPAYSVEQQVGTLGSLASRFSIASGFNTYILTPAHALEVLPAAEGLYNLAPEAPTYTYMETEIEQLKARVVALEEEIAELKGLSVEEEVIMLKDVTRSDAKTEIKELFQSGGTWYYSDIARKLKIDLSTVVELCTELMNEGEIYVNTTDDANTI
jgi:hypothetical protein